MSKVYIASGWFTPEQEARLEEVLSACKKAGVEVYSPRDDFQYVKGMNPAVVFVANLNHIEDSLFVLASTEGKDIGTLFECGYAYGHGKPVVYYYPGKGKFNLMLGESATAVIDGPYRLEVYLNQVAVTGTAPTIKYEGDLE